MRFVFLFFLLVSCGDTLTTVSTSYYNIEHDKDSIWVCHNEKSDLHQQVCAPECYEPGNQSTFCWLLDREECKDPDSEYIDLCQTQEG